MVKKVVPVSRMRQHSVWKAGRGYGYMYGDKYMVSDGLSDDELIETGIPGLSIENPAAYRALCENLDDAELLYHPVPVGKYAELPETKASVQRYNIIAQHFIDNCDGMDGRTMLDIGCHYGYLSFSFAALGAQVLGIEPACKSVKICRMIKDCINSSVNFMVGSAENIVLQDKAYEVVLAMNMLHYVLADKSRKYTELFFRHLGSITGEYCVLSYAVGYPQWTIAHIGDVPTDICAMGGFQSVEYIGVANSYPIWVAKK